MKGIEQLIGRMLLGHIFLLAGISKLGAGFATTQGYMESMGVPGMLLPAVIAFEIAAGLAIIGGLFTRYTAWALAAFSVTAGVIFHFNPTDQMQTILLMKNIALAGGLLILAAAGAGQLSLDYQLQSRSEL